MKCPKCNKNTISNVQILLSSRIFKIKCKDCGVKFYCGGAIEIFANAVTYILGLLLIGFSILYNNVWLLFLLIFVFFGYEVVKTKYSKWVIVNDK